MAILFDGLVNVLLRLWTIWEVVRICIVTNDDHPEGTRQLVS